VNRRDRFLAATHTSHIPHAKHGSLVATSTDPVAPACFRVAADILIASHRIRIASLRIAFVVVAIRLYRYAHAPTTRNQLARHCWDTRPRTATHDRERRRTTPCIYILRERKPLGLRRQPWWKTSTWRLRGGAKGSGTDAVDRYIGLMLAVSSSLAIGTSAQIHTKGRMLTVRRREFCHYEKGPKCVHGEAWLRRRRLRIPAKPRLVGGHNNE
jgi:hypothetical protein